MRSKEELEDLNKQYEKALEEAGIAAQKATLNRQETSVSKEDIHKKKKQLEEEYQKERAK